MSHAETSELSVNDSGTCGKIDTPLTQPRSPAVPVAGPMRFVRAQVGAFTPHGHAISNTIEILEARQTYVRPDWATHETQTLNWRLAWQADHMAGASRLPKGEL